MISRSRGVDDDRVPRVCHADFGSCSRAIVPTRNGGEAARLRSTGVCSQPEVALGGTGFGDDAFGERWQIQAVDPRR